jgi:hypothetical protein
MILRTPAGFCSQNGRWHYPSIWVLILRSAAQRARALATQTDIFEILSSLIRYDIPWHPHVSVPYYLSSLLSWCCGAFEDDRFR